MFLAAKQLDIAAKDIIYIGDHPRDIDAGKAANMPTVLAAYGYLPPDRAADLVSWQADYIVEDVEALTQLILSQID